MAILQPVPHDVLHDLVISVGEIGCRVWHFKVECKIAPVHSCHCLDDIGEGEGGVWRGRYKIVITMESMTSH